MPPRGTICCRGTFATERRFPRLLERGNLLSVAKVPRQQIVPRGGILLASLREKITPTPNKTAKEAKRSIGRDMDGYSRPRKWLVAEDAGYMFSYPRRPNDLPDNFHTTHDVKGYVPMVSTQNSEVGARHSGEKGYVEMKSVEPEYVNVPRGTGKYGREQVYGAASMNYSIPAPRVPTEAQNVTKHHVYVNVPQRSRLTSEGAECSSGVSDVSGCSPEFVSRSPGVVSGCSPEFVSRFPGVSDVSGCSPEFVSRSPAVSDVSGCSPEFVSRSPGVSDLESSSEFLSQSPGVPLHLATSQPKMPGDTDGRGTGGFTGKTTEGTTADYRHVDMEPVAGGRCYHVYRTPAFNQGSCEAPCFDKLEEQGYRCIVSINETSASRAFGLSGTRELEVDMGTPAIILTPRAGEGSSPPITWPLHYIRRYGTDGDRVFRIEAGRRCYPGPGIFTFTVLSGNSQDILAKVELASEMHLNVTD
ncbi:hypothetical protein Bbelb_175030 [Branchiostoma belcheri]|nr:hypothetical protein Bbelb_175030 [Branchiostoma belcheri]